MPKFDANDALDDLFDDGYASGAGAAVATRTEAILDGPAPSESIDAVLRLADGLPSLDDVREVAEDDTSELTEKELEQKAQTEEVIRTALATGDASVWVIAQGLERVAKGKWWRRTHRTLAAYVEDITGRSAVYARQLRAGAPLALETAERTGSVPNPGQVKETLKTEKRHGRDAAVTLYEVVRDVSAQLGEKPTAAALRAVHEELPANLPEVPEQQRAVIEETARTTLGLQSAAIAAPAFESESNKSAAIAAPRDAGEDDAVHEAEVLDDPQGEAARPTATNQAPENEPGSAEEDDDIQDAEVIPDHLATLKDALRQLNQVHQMLAPEVYTSAAVDPAAAEEYEKIRTKIAKKATAIRNRALNAPKKP